ncbi:hypothetical protein [Ectopseudomonas oleovorans]|uniref:hypothetical protein n=1 Tax=Ectopseudomonas oleovorans TaxID=301 RepID=UPI003F1DCC86
MDDLRNAKEFYDCCVAESAAGHNDAETGTFRDAEDWLRSAALNLGAFLVSGEVPNA